MPDSSIDVVPTTDRLPTTAATVTERGLLCSLSASIIRGSTKSGRTHILAGLRSAALPPALFHTVLIDDYVYDGHSPSWTGVLPLEPGDQIQATVRSSDAICVRTMGRTIMQPFPIVTLEP